MKKLAKEVLELVLKDKEVKEKYEEQFFGFNMYWGLTILHDVCDFWEEFEDIYLSQKSKDIKKACLIAFERINDESVSQLNG